MLVVDKKTIVKEALKQMYVTYSHCYYSEYEDSEAGTKQLVGLLQSGMEKLCIITNTRLSINVRQKDDIFAKLEIFDNIKNDVVNCKTIHIPKTFKELNDEIVSFYKFSLDFYHRVLLINDEEEVESPITTNNEEEA